MMLVCHRDLPPIQPLMLSAKQGGTGSHFSSLWYDPAGDRTPTSQSQGGQSNHKAMSWLHILSTQFKILSSCFKVLLDGIDGGTTRSSNQLLKKIRGSRAANTHKEEAQERKGEVPRTGRGSSKERVEDQVYASGGWQSGICQSLPKQFLWRAHTHTHTRTHTHTLACAVSIIATACAQFLSHFSEAREESTGCL